MGIYYKLGEKPNYCIIVENKRSRFSCSMWIFCNYL